MFFAGGALGSVLLVVVALLSWYTVAVRNNARAILCSACIFVPQVQMRAWSGVVAVGRFLLRHPCHVLLVMGCVLLRRGAPGLR